jgi:isopentenyl-diphosphate delta-isomerase
MTIRSEIGKYYATLFLTKFLDREHSLIRDYRDECCKPQIYSPSDVKVTVYSKMAETSIQIKFSEFLKTPSVDIDYTKDFSIEAPKGLLAEIQRHYVMYLRDYYAIGLIEKSCLDRSLDFSELSEEQVSAIKSYALRKGISLSEEKLEQSQVPLFYQELELLRKIFSKRYTMTINEHEEVRSIANGLLGEGIDRNLFHFIDGQTLAIDPKMLALLFHGKDKGIFSCLDTENLPLDLLEHLKLEGEEHYFYKTTDELITYMGQYSRFILKESSKKGYCLAPIDSSYILEAKRPLYQNVLERDTFVIDQHGKAQKPVTGKTIIHFQLQPERKAFATYKKLIQNEPNQYPSLKRWISMGSHELLDLVSNEDAVIGVMPRTDVYAKNLNNFRVINAFLINSKGEIWVPTRSSSASLFPLCLDCSVGGHVLSNESYFDAFCREAEEEINLNSRNYPHSVLGRLTPHMHGTSAFMEVYAINYDGPVHFNTDDFLEGRWVAPNKLKAMLKNGVPAKKDLRIILDVCFPDA